MQAVAAAISVLTDFSPATLAAGYQVPLEETLIRVERQEIGRATRFEQQLPASVAATLTHAGRDFQTIAQAGGSKLEGYGYTAYRGELADRVGAGEEVTLPVLASYGPDRLPRTTTAAADRSKLQRSRLRGYEDCLVGVRMHNVEHLSLIHI